VSKKEKKKEKKEKKKKKKEKKEKRKKRKSKASETEEEEEESQPKVEAEAGNSSDEELWGFFENMEKPKGSADKTDILMVTMKKKSEARIKRLKEIEEDRREHQ
jgi:hypothetical protein